MSVTQTRARNTRALGEQQQKKELTIDLSQRFGDGVRETIRGKSQQATMLRANGMTISNAQAHRRAPLRTVFVSSALASAHAWSIVSVDELLKSSSVSVGELLDNNSIAFSGYNKQKERSNVDAV